MEKLKNKLKRKEEQKKERLNITEKGRKVENKGQRHDGKTRT